MALKPKTTPLNENEKLSDTTTAVADAPNQEVPWGEQAEAMAENTKASEVVPHVAASPGTAVSAPAAAPSRSFLQASAQDDGFSALDDQIGFGSFPIVKLDGSDFIVEKSEYEELNVVLHSARAKYLYKAGPKDADPIFYSYDKIKDTSGASVESRLKEWKAEGFSNPTESMYMECAATVLSEGAHQGRIVLLSVAPSSVKRLGGYRAELAIKGKQLSQVITRVFPGDKITTVSKKTYNPWNFSYVGPYTPSNEE